MVVSVGAVIAFVVVKAAEEGGGLSLGGGGDGAMAGGLPEGAQTGSHMGRIFRGAQFSIRLINKWDAFGYFMCSRCLFRWKAVCVYPQLSNLPKKSMLGNNLYKKCEAVNTQQVGGGKISYMINFKL